MTDLHEPASGFVLPQRLAAPPRLTERHPALFPLAVRVHRARRRVAWIRSGTPWSSTRSAVPLDARVKRHRSLLLRELGDSDMRLQHSKVTNLRLATARVDGILLHWMFLHSPLTVVERSEHSFDPFPDNGRVLPWGVGCSIVYNYVDLVVRNDTAVTFQILTRVGDRYLEGDLRADRPLDRSYRVHARDEQFLRHRGQHFRRNEIWRTVIDKRTGDPLREELVKRNCAKVMYLPQGVPVLEVPDPP